MTNYIYTPNRDNEFKCKVPLENTAQLFVVDGTLQASSVDAITAGVNGGYDFKVAKNTILDQMLQIISVRSNIYCGSQTMDCEKKCAGEQPVKCIDSVSYTNTIELDQGAQAKLLLCSHTLNDHFFVTEESFAIKLGENSNLDLVIMQNEHENSRHNSNFTIDLAANAVLKMHVVALHGGELSNKFEINLNGKGAECVVNGLYLASGKQRISNILNLSHKVPECNSRQLFKGILDGEAVTRFSGTILVAKDAQKTEAYQANNNLIVSDYAKAYTQPHLEIYADDVKCSHGATVGSLNEDELFYMRSRGISMKEAKLLQQQAFAYAALANISNVALLDRLSNLVERRLRGEFASCSDCNRHSC